MLYILLGFRLLLYGACDSVMHLCPFCTKRTINLLDDDDDDDEAEIGAYYSYRGSVFLLLACYVSNV